MRTNDGGPAFPSPDTVHPSGQVQYGSFGMTLRDFLASRESLSEWYTTDGRGPTQGLAELLAGCKQPAAGGDAHNQMEWLIFEAKWRAAVKYLRADAMIAAREKGNE